VSLHLPQTLAEAIDVVLLVATGVTLFRWRSHLSGVVFLLAAEPLWSLAAASLHVADLARSTPAQQAVAVVATDAPLWGAFILGLFKLLGSPSPPARPDGKAVAR